MRHHRSVSSHHPVSGPDLLGAAGRYPLHERPPLALHLGPDEIQPVGPLRIYACGITPYDVTHVGHASTFVWADTLAAVAHAGGNEVFLARNVTDVDDVLTESARGTGWRYDELALTQEFHFDRDMKALRVSPPGAAPHARAHIVAVIRLAARLLAVGAAYERDGHVWFRGAHVPEVAGLDAHRALEASRAYGDQAGSSDRESDFDVPVWRPSDEEDPAWPSPWGWGRPGWHAECAAMALCSIGASIDVLIGGGDLAFPHHAYQSLMVEAAAGVRPFAQATMHVGEVCVDGVKMAKSTGNLVLVSSLLQRFEPAAVRLGLLLRPWHEPWDCTDEVFGQAASVLGDLRAAAAGSEPPRYDADVLDALSHDLDVPEAVRRALGSGSGSAAYLLDVLRLTPAE